jgi:hypothetical protein
VNRSAFAFLPANQDFNVIGQALDSEGKVWWELDKNQIPGGEMALSLWVAEEEVEEIGNCAGVPQAEVPPIIPGGPPPGGPGQPGGGPTPPPGWGPCGSCDTCGHPASECVTSPDGQCLWDPKTCAPPPPGGQCFYLTTQVVPRPGMQAYITIGKKPDCPDGGYSPGTQVPLSAYPQYRMSWTGTCPGATGTNPNIVVTMNFSCTAIAVWD